MLGARSAGFADSSPKLARGICEPRDSFSPSHEHFAEYALAFAPSVDVGVVEKREPGFKVGAHRRVPCRALDPRPPLASGKPPATIGEASGDEVTFSDGLGAHAGRGK